jgi:hypothetical protein
MKAALLAFTAVYIATSVWLMSARPFWIDELYTLYISDTDSAALTLRMVAERADHHPPPFFLLTRLFLQLPLPAEIAARLPGMLGYGLMCFCLYDILRRRASALFGLVAMCGALAVLPHVYSFEARPYGLLAGFCALALWGWLAANEGRRGPGLAACFGGLAAAVSVHHYAVLFVFPLAAGQLVRTVSSRRVDWAVWSCFAAGGAVSLLYFPQVVGSLERFPERHWAMPNRFSFVDVYAHTVGRWGLAFFAASGLVLTLFARRLRRIDWPGPHEVTAVAAIVFLPFLCQAVAIKTGAIHGRYAIGTLIGALLSFGWVAWSLSKGSRRVAFVLVGLATVFFAANAHHRWEIVTEPDRTAIRLTGWLRETRGPALPVVVDDPLAWMPMAHYAREPWSGRFHYLLDEEAARRLAEIPFLGRGLSRIATYRPLPVLKREEFLGRHSRYLLLDSGSSFAYIRRAAVAEGARVKVLRSGDGWSLLLVENARSNEIPGKPASTDPGRPANRY